MARYQVASVPYLNAKPLVEGLEAPGSLAQVSYAVPSRLPALLDSGEAQAVLVSSIESLRRPDAHVADGVSISTFGEVMSVRLFSRVPFNHIQTLALDQSSMTSNALATILLRELHGADPTARPFYPDLKEMLAENDAGILIGDNGMRADETDLFVLDLGEAWTTWTGLPFVWALWLGGKELTPELARLLADSRDEGLSAMPARIPFWAEATGFDEPTTSRYLTQVMRYGYGPSEKAGFGRFAELLVRHELLPEVSLPEVISGLAAQTTP